MKIDKSFKENKSKEFCKEREKYFEIQDLKAQLQDKGIVISELKKLIAKLKGKYLDTKFEKSSVIRQPNAFKCQRPSILGNLTIFSDSLERNDFSKSKMYKLQTELTQTRTSQLPQDSRKTNKHVSFSIGVIPTTSVTTPKLKSNPMGDRVLCNNSQGKKHDVEDHRRSVKFSKNKTSVTTFASESNQKPKNITRKLYERVSKECSWWYPKFTPLGYKWKPKSEKENVNPNVSMPLGSLVEIVLLIVDSSCLKHMTGNLKLLINFVEKFLEGILHQMSVSRTPEQNGVVERWNRTLVEAARTMLSAAKVPLFFWAEAIATTCFTQNRSLEKGDACILVGYSTKSRAYRVFNKRTRVIVETIHVNFDELPQMTSDHASSNPVPELTTSNELDFLFSLVFDELLNESSKVVSKSSAVNTADAPNQRQQQQITPLNNHITPESTCHDPTQAPSVTSIENMNHVEMVKEYAQVENDEFINIFCTPVQDKGETSSRYVDSSNMHTFYQHYPFEHRWTKYHPLEQVIGNPLQSVRTRCQLDSDGEMFDRPLCKNVINMKWLWKNKRDEENTVIRNKSHLVSKGTGKERELGRSILCRSIQSITAHSHDLCRQIGAFSRTSELHLLLDICMGQRARGTCCPPFLPCFENRVNGEWAEGKEKGKTEASNGEERRLGRAIFSYGLHLPPGPEIENPAPFAQKEGVDFKESFAPVTRLEAIVQLILFIVDSGCTKHMTGNLKLLCNFVEKFLGTVRFSYDQFAPILRYGYLVQGNVTINKGNDLLTGNRGSDLYTISLQESTSSTPVCLMAKATPT
nr:hypothetical protein [Tanacetum cinerariifolium]